MFQALNVVVPRNFVRRAIRRRLVDQSALGCRPLGAQPHCLALALADRLTHLLPRIRQRRECFPPFRIIPILVASAFMASCSVARPHVVLKWRRPFTSLPRPEPQQYRSRCQ